MQPIFSLSTCTDCLRHPRVLRGLIARGLVASALAITTGCSSPDLSGPVSTDPEQLYWAMTLSAHAITMSTAVPYDTLQLTAVPRNVTGTPLAGAPTPTFHTTDSSVRVSSTGLLTARAVRNNVKVIAELTYQGIRLADTAVVNVTAEVSPPAASQLYLALRAGDSATVAAPRLLSAFYYSPTKILHVSVLDADGQWIPSSVVALRTTDTSQATVSATVVAPDVPSPDTGTVEVIINNSTSRLGRVWVYANATVYGVTLQDSFPLQITPPLFVQYSIAPQAVAGSTIADATITPSAPVVLGVGGYVWWLNTLGVTDSVDIVFDDPSAASEDPLPAMFFGHMLLAGDIPPFPGFPGGEPSPTFDNFASRQFRRAGTFHFHSVRAGISGTIIVQ